MRSGDPGDFNDYRYEYDSGVGVMALEGESNTQIYLVNRGGQLIVARAFLYQAVVAGANNLKFDSGVAVVPPGTFCLLGHGPRHKEDVGMYWARILATSPGLVMSMRVWRTETEPPISDVYFAPNDFAVFELLPNPLLEIQPMGPLKSQE